MNMLSDSSPAGLGDFNDFESPMAGYDTSFESTALFTEGSDFTLLGGSMATVSPEELLRGLDSAPSSGHLDHYSPNTPYSTLFTSPNVMGDDYLGANTLSLFGENDTSIAAMANPMVRDLSTNSLSSSSASPGAGHAKRPSLSKLHTSSSGVVKQSRRRSAKDLPAIPVDHTNPKDVKRARNTAAARVSRSRKVSEKSSLVNTVEHLRAVCRSLGYDGPGMTEYMPSTDE